MITVTKSSVSPAAMVLMLALAGLMPQRATAAWAVGTPIVHWGGDYWDGGGQLTDARAQQAVAGGYNLVMCWTIEEVAVADRYGLRAMFVIDGIHANLGTEWLDDSAKKAELDAKITAYKTHPSAYSYYVWDEPSTSQFAALRRTVDYLRASDPQRMAYINLFPTYASNAHLGTTGDTVTAYNDYLSQYRNAVQPSLVSYDHYQFKSDGSDTGQYLLNLQLVSKAANDAGLPFVTYVQASSWDPAFRVPNANELRFLNTTALAYGAQGINYFNKWANGGTSADVATVYAALTPINREFVKIATQLQRLKWTGTYLKGYHDLSKPDGTTLLPADAPFSINIYGPDMQYYEGTPLKGALLGLFGTDGTVLSDAAFAFVTNLDYVASQTFTVTGPGNLSIFDATTGLWTSTGQNYITRTFPPGGGILVGLTSLVPVPEPASIVPATTGAVVLVVCGWWKRKRVDSRFMIQEEQ